MLGVGLCLVIASASFVQTRVAAIRPISEDAFYVGREAVKFDFAWRFHLGDISSGVNCPDNAFPRNLSKVECMGLKEGDARSADDCRNLCCGDVMCAIWQYFSEKGCWIGTSDDCTHPGDSWVGGGRSVPAQPPPPAKDGPASKSYDDSSWELVDVPHDGLIAENYSESAPEKHAYIPTNITWYRKHFNLPTDWKGQSIWIYFEGIFRASTVFFNGQQLLYHDSGYTSFTVRLDNASSVSYGEGKDNDNVVAVRADGTSGTGWWYEGVGIYRHTHLVTANLLHITADGLYGAANVTGTIKFHDPSDHSKGQIADKVEFYPQVELVNDGSSDVQNVKVSFNLYDESGSSVSSFATATATVGSGKVVILTSSMTVSEVELWSINRPYLYVLEAQVMSGSRVVDTRNTTLGVRSIHWDPNNGFFLNDVHFIWRGFNNHNDFTGVGVAVPDRINLFRGQSIRAVGGNSWRMSHNPPIPVMLDILDRVGVVVWDENRVFGDNEIWVENERDMVKRDRNHPSVMIWSFCNEAGCNLNENEQEVASSFKKVSNDEDSFRFVTANQNGHIGGGLSSVIDVQGFSHRPGSSFDSYHQQYPKKPLIGSECCSCRTQRGEDFPPKSTFSNFNADCNQAQTGNQLNRAFVAGCMVWTLFDYYGEPTPYGWPMVSSSFGSIDLAGFAKASAFWYRAWWLFSAMQNKSDSGADVPLNPPSLINPDASPSEESFANGYMIHIVEHWEAHENVTTRTVHAYTNAPMAELFVNGKSQGVQQLEWQGWAQWSVTFSPGNLTANALSAQKSVMASHTVLTAGVAAKLVAHIDVPSMETHTGSALVLDGQDAGMVRAAIVDSNGRVVPSSSHNVTFKVLSGPGRIIGVGNGDPSCHEPNQASWRSAYHGLARAIIQVTVNSASLPEHRRRLLQVDSEGGIRTYIAPPGTLIAAEGIVVEASSPGLGTSTVTIPVTNDVDSHGVLTVAGGKFLK